MARKKQGVKITSAMLSRFGACGWTRRKLRRRWPKGVWVTQAWAEKHANHRLLRDWWGWAAGHLLEPHAADLWRVRINTANELARSHTSMRPRTYGVSPSIINVIKASVFADIFQDQNNRRLK